MYPAPLLPNLEWLRCVNSEKIQRLAMAGLSGGMEFGPGKPIIRKFIHTIPHIPPAKNPQGEHLLGGELRFEQFTEIRTCWFRELILITLLHFIVHFYYFSHTLADYYDLTVS
jgi:hypothetical protein